MDDSLQTLMEVVEQTNTTFLRQLLHQVSKENLQMFYTHFCVSTIDELIVILQSNATTSSSNCTAGNREAREQPATAAVITLMMTIPVIIILVGTVGNLLTFLILITDRTMRTVSTYFYLAILALADTFVLYMGLMTLWISFLIGHDVRVESTWLCKVNTALGHTVSDFSVWLLVAVTCERFVVVCFPLHASAICRRSTARMVVLVLLSVLCAINFHLFITADVTTNRNDLAAMHNDSYNGNDYKSGMVIKVLCGGKEGFKFLVEKVWPWVDAVLYSLLPFVIIATLNAFIFSQVMAAKRRRQQLCSASRGGGGGGGGGGERGSVNIIRQSSNLGGGKSRREHESQHHKLLSSSANSITMAVTSPATPSRASVGAAALATHTASSSSSADGDSLRLTIMLLAVTFTFLITTLPITVVNIAGMVMHRLNNKEQLAMYDLTRRICELLMYANHSINFFLYCAAGQKFRRQLIVLLCWLCCRRSRRYAVERRQGTAYATVTTCIDHCSPDFDDVADHVATGTLSSRRNTNALRGHSAKTRHQRLSNGKP